MSRHFVDVQNNKCLLSTCNLNQWALDFDGNLARTIESIKIAKAAGSKYRLGPELEICGYSCEDHFLELDTFMHCDQSLAVILESDLTVGILCDIGCPILHNNVRYNCRVLCLDRKIVLIRPKVYLADDGNYREKRFFTPWSYTDTTIHEHQLSDLLRKVTGQITVPIGLGIIATEETTIASEVCEELWSAKSPHIGLYLSGVEIVTNGSGSHHVLRKLNSRLTLMKNATHKCGGAYVFANQRGCDGNRLYFDGSSLICVNGEVVAQATQFSLRDVEVVTAVVDLDSIRSHRNGPASLQEQSSQEKQLPVINLRHFSLRSHKSAAAGMHSSVAESTPIQARVHSPEEECALGPACWLWDYLRRSGAAGFLLPLSGGADSASVAAIVRVMCCMVAREALEGNAQVVEDVQRMFRNNAVTSPLVNSLAASDGLQQLSSSAANLLVTDAETDAAPARSSSAQSLSGGDSREVQLANELCYQVLHTLYLGTVNSSTSTQDRAKRLAGGVHSYHNALGIDEVVSAVLSVFSLLTAGKVPRYESQGGTPAEDLALQNIQARLRMVMSYLCAQLFPWLRGNKGFLLVLGSANVDEALRGYMTKYDCSSADLNPIGGMSKADLKRMLLHVAETHNLPTLKEIAEAAPTAELRPSSNNTAATSGNATASSESGTAVTRAAESSQTDEEDMGMSYAELGIFGYLRKVLRCGPVKMFLRLTELWKHLAPAEVAVKVKRFFFYYSVNRHKLTTLTPSYHAEGYSPDDNRFDLRQFLYNTKWTRQFDTIDSILEASTAHISSSAASASRGSPVVSEPATPVVPTVAVAAASPPTIEAPASRSGSRPATGRTAAIRSAPETGAGSAVASGEMDAATIEAQPTNGTVHAEDDKPADTDADVATMTEDAHVVVLGDSAKVEAAGGDEQDDGVDQDEDEDDDEEDDDIEALMSGKYDNPFSDVTAAEEEE